MASASVFGLTYAELPAELLAPVVNGLPAPRIADLNARIAALKEAA